MMIEGKDLVDNLVVTEVTFNDKMYSFLIVLNTFPKLSALTIYHNVKYSRN